MTLAKAKAKAKAFIVQISLMIVTYDCHDIFIVQAQDCSHNLESEWVSEISCRQRGRESK